MNAGVELAARDRGVRHADPLAAAGSIRVVVACAVRLYSNGLGGALQHAPGSGIVVVGCAAGAMETLQLVAARPPAVVLLDVSMHGAVAVAGELRATCPQARTLMLVTDDCAGVDLLSCVRAGALGYVAPDGSLDDLVAAVQSAARGEVVCSPRFAAQVFDHVAELAQRERPEAALDQLTAREREIVELLAHGLSNKEIARRLAIRVPTVKNHVHSVLEKLGVRSRAAAARLARGSVEACCS
jgi:two-component system, NarL family, nitrate/nitrite response regulator NarL